jgi:hypothetical protein
MAMFYGTRQLTQAYTIGLNTDNFDNILSPFDENLQLAMDTIDNNLIVQNGFENREDSVITFDDLTRTFTISPVGDSFTVWSFGRKFVITQPKSIQLEDVEGYNYIHFNIEGELEIDTEFNLNELVYNGAYCGYVNWDAANSKATFFGDERHKRMDAESHAYLHEVVRASIVGTGFNLTNIIADQNGNDDEDAQLAVLDLTRS